MNSLRHPLRLLATAILLGSAVARAQSADPAVQSPPPIDDMQPPLVVGIPNSTPEGAKPQGSAEQQPTTSAMIVAGLPRYDPPKPVPAKPEDQDVDLRNVDKPQNGIVRLPTYYVRTARQAVLKEPDLVTQEGMAKVGMKRYPGLALTPFAWLNAMNYGVAKEMYLEDERLRKISDLTETANSIGRGGDTVESEYIKRETQDAYLRPIDWGGLPPK